MSCATVTFSDLHRAQTWAPEDYMRDPCGHCGDGEGAHCWPSASRRRRSGAARTRSCWYAELDLAPGLVVIAWLSGRSLLRSLIQKEQHHGKSTVVEVEIQSNSKPLNGYQVAGDSTINGKRTLILRAPRSRFRPPSRRSCARFAPRDTFLPPYPQLKQLRGLTLG